MEKKTGKESTTLQLKDEHSEKMKSLDAMLDRLGIKEVEPSKTVTIMFKK